MRVIPFLGFVLIGLVACGGYQGIREPLLTPANARWQRRLERTARTDLACRTVRLIPLSETVIQADGCSRVAEYGLFCLGSRNCDWRAFERVATHAARDLSCPETSLSITASDAMVRDVYGCGRAASYSLNCVPQHCAWTATTITAPVSASVDVTAVSADVVIPPPPGASETIPPPPGEPSIPPPPGASESGTDDLVIPPPPS